MLGYSVLMAQLAFVIDIPGQVKADLPTFVVHGEELARHIRQDLGNERVSFVSSALTDQVMVPQAVNADTYTAPSVQSDKTKSRTVSAKRVLISGGAAGDLTVTGIKTTHVLLAVLKVVDANQAFTDLTSEFTITGTNKINNTGGTATTSSHVVVVYA